MRGRRGLFLVFFALLATLAFPQSLVDMAKKEKERREKNDKEAVEVIDSQSLRTGESATSDAPPPEDDEDNREKRTTPSSKESAQERRERCDAELAQAKAEKEYLQKRYDAGVSSSATAQGDQVRGANGRGIVGTGAPDVRVGGRTSCAQALKDPKFYANAAAKCQALQSRIDAAEEKIRAANDCFRKR